MVRVFEDRQHVSFLCSRHLPVLRCRSTGKHTKAMRTKMPFCSLSAIIFVVHVTTSHYSISVSSYMASYRVNHRINVAHRKGSIAFYSSRSETRDDRPYWESSDDSDEDVYNRMQQQQQQPPEQIQESDELLGDNILEWEKYVTNSGTAWILLPPLSVTKPTCIIHFVGGTFMGSSPHIWYRSLLQDLVRHTSCAIVATSIPVTIDRSPLNHVRLSTQLLDQFRSVHQDVMVNEYGRDVIQSVPICGMGHSLGARLLAVLTTLTLGHIQQSRKGQALLSYKAMILISFTNYGAAAGIPGVATLSKKSRNIERQAQQQRKPSKRTKMDTKWWDDDEDSDYGTYGGYDFDDDDDDSWSTIWNEVADVIQLGATSVQNALTPPSQALEFYPTPEQLWTAIQTNGRYNIPQTLLVQFDDDEIDQSSRLATTILNCSDVKFARLRGTHLTPITRKNDPTDADARTRSQSASFLQQVNNNAERILVKTLQGRQDAKRNVVAFLELRQSIARYITEIVTK